MAKGGNAFKKFIAKVAGSSNGRTPGFGPGYIGSSPIPAAKVGSIEVDLCASILTQLTIP